MSGSQRIFIFVIFLVGTLWGTPAEEIPSLTVSPEKVTMSVGETRTFRAVGKDGRPRHGVSWTISPEGAAKLTTNGDEATVTAQQEGSGIILTAHVENDSAEAEIEILAGALPTGTKIWSVDHLPGCTTKHMSQAVPSANRPDLYVEEDCPQGTFIRALTSDGREMWRRQITGAGADPVHTGLKAEPEPLPHPLDFHPNSLCDGISPGMSKNDVAKLVKSRSLQLRSKEFQGDTWSVEERGSRCTISFDAKTATVVKKRKVIVTD
jgi:hypothetical protein